MVDPAARYRCVDAVQGNEMAIGEKGIEYESNDPADGMLRVEIYKEPMSVYSLPDIDGTYLARRPRE